MLSVPFQQSIGCHRCHREVFNQFLALDSNTETITEVYCLDCASAREGQLQGLVCFMNEPIASLDAIASTFFDLASAQQAS